MQSVSDRPAAPPQRTAILHRVYGGLKVPEWCALVLIGVCLCVQLFVSPVIGMADNGDFDRAMSWFGLRHSVTTYQDMFFRYVDLRYAFDPAVRSLKFYTSQSVPLGIAVGLNSFLNGWSWFDLRVLGAVYVASLMGALSWLFRSTQHWTAAARFTVLVAAAVVLTDAAYVSYFNSMYSEPASLVFAIASFAAILEFVRHPSRSRLIGCVAIIILFTTSKPQNVAAGLLLGALLMRLAFVRSDRRVRVWSVACAVLIFFCSAAYYKSVPDELVRVSHYIAVFMGVLPGSYHPASDLQEFGVPPSYAKYTDTHPFTPDYPTRSPQFKRDFFAHVNMPKIMFFYAKHPERLTANIDRVAGTGGISDRQVMGNYTSDSGRQPIAMTESFVWWTGLRTRFVPKSFTAFATYSGIGLFLTALAWIAVPERRLYAEIFLTVLLVAISQFLIVCIAQSTLESAKHLYLFRFLFDACLFALAAGLIVCSQDVYRRRGLVHEEELEETTS